jgi:hypothetical protein
MKKILFAFLLVGCSGAGFCQVQDIEQLQLDLEKLVQMKSMLSSMYQGYATLSSGYNQITGLAKGNFDLHKNYLDALLQVAPQVKNYPAIQAIIDKQAMIISESANAYTTYVKSGLFSVTELVNTKVQLDGFKTLISKKLGLLNLLLTAGALRMSDEERLAAIDRVDKDVGEALGAERTLVKEQNAVAAIRGQRKKEIEAMRMLYGLKQ